MSLSRPTATIVLDGQKLTSAEAGLVSLRIDLGFNTHDRAHLTLWPNSKLSSAGPGSEMSITLSTEGSGGAGLLDSVPSLPGLGGDDDGTLWTGIVQSVQSAASMLSITGLASTSLLSDTRRSATWSDQSVADIVRDLAGELESEIEADLTLPNFSVDNSRTVWSYLYELAQLAGAELSCSAQGGVRFILASKNSSVIELHYGADLIEWNLSQDKAMTPVGASEHAAASSAGNEKWHWLAHDPVGSNEEAMLLPASFHTRTAAETFTDAAKSRAKRAAMRGQIWISGREKLRPGSQVELKQMPDGSDCLLRVRAVTHQLDVDSGFVTALAVEGTASEGALF